jgi:hypothetical protein
MGPHGSWSEAPTLNVGEAELGPAVVIGRPQNFFGLDLG